MPKADTERSTLMAQTVYLGTLGLVSGLPQPDSSLGTLGAFQKDLPQGRSDAP